MNDVLHFFDPRPLRGVLLPLDTHGKIPAVDEPTNHWLELCDVNLTPSGEFVLSLQGNDGAILEWRGGMEIHEAEDGNRSLVLAELGYLLFPPSEWGRVTDMFMKLANRIF